MCFYFLKGFWSALTLVGAFEGFEVKYFFNSNNVTMKEVQLEHFEFGQLATTKKSFKIPLATHPQRFYTVQAHSFFPFQFKTMKK